MDFVLRDAYMSGYSQRSFDLDRLLHYSFFSEHGLTIHDRGMNALMRFMAVRAELFRSIYFHRTVRAIDLTLADLFADSRDLIFPGNPLEHLDAVSGIHGMVVVGRCFALASSCGPTQRANWACVGSSYCIVRFRGRWWCSERACLTKDDAEQSSIFSDPRFVEQKLRDLLPACAARSAVARRYCTAHSAPAHAWSQRRSEFSLRFGTRRGPAAECQRVVFSLANQPADLPGLRAWTKSIRRSWLSALDTLIGGSVDDPTNM